MTIQGERHCISTVNLTANDCSKHLLFAEH
nr:MAG TPA_asm: hypothetical protein [Bacteriophage sp.]